jgi:hypothetical protein
MKKPAQYILIVLSISALLLLLSNFSIFREGIDEEDTTVQDTTSTKPNMKKQKPPGFPGSQKSKFGSKLESNKPDSISTRSRSNESSVNKGGSQDSLGKECVASEGCKTYMSKYLSTPAGVNPAVSSDVDTSYSYVNFIKTPGEMKISDKGTIETLKRDVEGLAEYAKLLIEGSSDASKAPNKGPLGNKFFVKTMGKCNDINTMDPTKKEKDRYLYINNVPLGNIPMLSSESGTNYKDFRGLIPGMMMNMDVLNPANIAAAFSSTGTPDCQEITMQTINSKNTVSSETNYVTISDISSLDPCLFTPDKQKKRINPVTKEQCKEGFSTIENSESDASVSNSSSSIHDAILHDIETDYIAQTFIVSVSLFGIFLFYKTLYKQ